VTTSDVPKSIRCHSTPRVTFLSASSARTPQTGRQGGHAGLLATDLLGRVQHVDRMKTTNSGILTEKLKADDRVDALTVWLNFKF
jgi:hypothetical protein